MYTPRITSPNSPSAIAQRVDSGRLPRLAPFGIIFVRFVFALLAQALLAALFFALGKAHPWQAAAPWWTVYGTLIDIGSLLLLAWLTKREGIRLRELVGFERRWLARDLGLGLGLTVIYVALGAVGGTLLTFALYGTPQPPLVLMGGLPIWATLYSLLVWPVLWGITEEMLYQGYAWPRLQALTGRSWLAILIVAVGFGVQHMALPWVLDGKFMFWRFGPSFLIGLVVPLFYQRLRRLPPLIIAHWAANVISVLLLAV